MATKINELYAFLSVTKSAEVYKMDIKTVRTQFALTEKVDKHLLMVATKVAQNATSEEFVDFFLTGETPPIRLTNEEMQALKGGMRMDGGLMEGFFNSF